MSNKEFPKIESEKSESEEEIDEEVEENEKKERYIPIDEQIEICFGKMKEIAEKIDKLATEWDASQSFGNQPSDLENLERLYERPINVLSAQLAAKKVQLEILEHEQELEEKQNYSRED